MRISIFLALVLGPSLVLMGAILMVQPRKVLRLMHEVLSSEALIFFAGFLAWVLGLMIVISHNIWSSAFQSVISAFGWIMVFAGLLRMTFGTHLQDFGMRIVANRMFLRLAGGLMILLGAFLFISVQGQ